MYEFESFVLSDKGMSFSPRRCSEVREKRRRVSIFTTLIQRVCRCLACCCSAVTTEVSTLQLFNMVEMGDYVNSDSSSLLLFSPKYFEY